MQDINEELNAIMAGFANVATPTEPVASEPVQSPAVTPQEPIASDADPVNPAPVIEEPVTPVAQTPAPVDAEPSSFDDWDTTVTEPVQVEVPTTNVAPDFSNLSKALGVEIKSEQDIVTLITKAKEEAKPQSIRPELAKAIELDQKGGDFYEYLKVTSVDYSKEDPIQLYEDYIIESSADEKGMVDEDAINEYLDGLPKVEKEIRGKELQRRLIVEQSRRIQEIEAEAIRNKEKTDTELRAALHGLSDVNGFKISDKHRKEVFDWVASGKIMKDMFYGSDGKLDPAKVAKVAFRNLYYEQIDSYQKSKIKNSTKREILADLTNSTPASPAIQVSPGPKSGYDIGDYIQSLEQGFLTR